MKRRLVFTVFASLVTATIWAQPMAFGLRTESFGPQRLPMGFYSVDMDVDDLGRVWMATESHGLASYDGARLNQRSDQGTDGPIFFSSVEVIKTDLVLAGSNEGLHVFDGINVGMDTNWRFGPCIDIIDNGMGDVFALSSDALYRRKILGAEWVKEDIEGMATPYQITVANGNVLLSSAEGLWVRNAGATWMPLRDGDVRAAMALGETWLAVTPNGLEQLREDGWHVIMPEIKGFHRGIPTADGARLWLYGEKGIWHIREDGKGVQLHGTGGAPMVDVTSATLDGAGALVLSTGEGNQLLRIPLLDQWYDLRCQPFQIGQIESIEGVRSDSVWLVSEQGIIIAALGNVHRLDAPGEGKTLGLSSPRRGVMLAHGEYGVRQWSRANGWQQIERTALTDAEQVALRRSDDSIRPGVTVHYDDWGWYSRSAQRKVDAHLEPSIVVLEQSVEQAREGEGFWIRLGLPGVLFPSDVSLTYQLNRGVADAVGGGLRIYIPASSAGTHLLEVSGQGLVDLYYTFEVTPVWWRDPIIMMGAAAVILLIVIIFTWIRLRQLRVRRQWGKERMKLERMALRLQMNPHFTFNALESISAFVLQQQPKEAIGYLNRFAKLMRYTLESAQDSLVPLSEERAALDHYIALEQMRFSDGFQSVVALDPALSEDVYVPPMLLQPIVENAILHGLRPKIQSGDGECLVSLTYRLHPSEADCIEIIVEDTGVGRKAAKVKRSGDEGKKRSAATNILQSRLKALQEETGKVHRVQTEDLNEGTRVTLVLPLIEG